MKKLIAALAVVVLALGVGIASAATTKYPTHFKAFKAASTYAGFKGKIASPKGKCVKKRKVKLFRNNNKEKVASGKTNSKGKFEIAVGGFVPSGRRYYAKVTKKNLGGGKVCRGAKSKIAEAT